MTLARLPSASTVQWPSRMAKVSGLSLTVAGWNVESTTLPLNETYPSPPLEVRRAEGHERRRT